DGHIVFLANRAASWVILLELWLCTGRWREIVGVRLPNLGRGRGAAFRPLHRPHFPGARAITQRHGDRTMRKRRKRRAPFARAATTHTTQRGQAATKGARVCDPQELCRPLSVLTNPARRWLSTCCGLRRFGQILTERPTYR